MISHSTNKGPLSQFCLIDNIIIVSIELQSISDSGSNWCPSAVLQAPLRSISLPKGTEWEMPRISENISILGVNRQAHLTLRQAPQSSSFDIERSQVCNDSQAVFPDYLL